MNYRLVKFQKFNDNRGDLIVFLKESDLETRHKQFGQIYFVTFNKKGVIRGNHFHKKWHEWFGIVAGKLEVILEDTKTKERIELKLDAQHDKYIRLDIGPYVAHSFRSLTTYAALLNYADSEWSNKDSIYYKVI